MKHIFFILLFILAACGKDGTHQNQEGCDPKPVADTGGDVYFSPDPSQAKFSKIGKPVLNGDCEWSPKEGLSDPKACQPILSAPEKTMLYTLRVSNKCGFAEDSMQAVKMKEAPKPIPEIIIGGKKYPTGYSPGFKQYYRAQYRDFSVKAGHTAVDPTPEELDYKPFVQRIFRQLCGDCWTQGAATTFETLLAVVDRVSRFISRQAGIDCSGFGSCGGGQLSMAQYDSPRGAIYESEYKYVGSTQRCKMPSGPYHEASKGSFYVRDLNWPNLKRALMESGPLEVCGASSALGSGGWVSRNPGGGVDHCYSLVGWYQGAKHGKPAGEYGIIANSWGTGWGDAGYGYYLLAKDGTHLDGNVITEAQGVEYKAMCPMPHADGGPDRTIKLMPGAPNAVKLGVAGEVDTQYLWNHSDSLDNANVAQPIATPNQTTTYEVSASNKCGKVSALVTVHVFRE